MTKNKMNNIERVIRIANAPVILQKDDGLKDFCDVGDVIISRDHEADYDYVNITIQFSDGHTAIVTFDYEEWVKLGDEIAQLGKVL